MPFRITAFYKKKCNTAGKATRNDPSMTSENQSLPHVLGSSPRLAYVDGLRGVAAAMVVAYHMINAAHRTYPETIPDWLLRIGSFGRYGVDIFFVLSGFVIALSLTKAQPLWSYAGRFILRRSIRLDPPYWVAIALETGIIALIAAADPSYHVPIPSVQQVGAHLIYAQDLLGLGNIAPVFWSLCYEVQFYLISIFCVVALLKCSHRTISTPRLMQAANATLWLTCLASAVLYITAVPDILPGLFVDRWFQFSLGAILLLATLGSRNAYAIAALASVIFVTAVTGSSNEYRMMSTLATLATVGIMAWAMRSRRIRSILSLPSVQFLGATSYSLYLVHTIIGERVVVAAGRAIESGLVSMVFALVAGAIASLLGAYFLYRLVEIPSMNLAHRIRLRRKPGAGSEAPVAPLWDS